MPKPKKRLNLTIDEDILEKAKQLAELEGESLSSLVEAFLSRIADEVSPRTLDWLEDFHRRHLPEGYKEPSDEELEKTREEAAKRH